MVMDIDFRNEVVIIKTKRTKTFMAYPQQTEPAYLHFFWASCASSSLGDNNSALPPRQALKNMNEWREYLKRSQSEFMPILWVNTRVFNEIKYYEVQSCKLTPSKKYFIGHHTETNPEAIKTKLPPCWHGSYNYLMDNLVPKAGAGKNQALEDIALYWGSKRGFKQSYPAHISCDYMVINYETWLQAWSTINPNIENFLAVNEHLLEHNFPRIVKDIFRDQFLLLLFPGVTMDVDTQLNPEIGSRLFHKNLKDLREAIDPWYDCRSTQFNYYFLHYKDKKKLEDAIESIQTKHKYKPGIYHCTLSIQKEIGMGIYAGYPKRILNEFGTQAQRIELKKVIGEYINKCVKPKRAIVQKHYNPAHLINFNDNQVGYNVTKLPLDYVKIGETASNNFHVHTMCSILGKIIDHTGMKCRIKRDVFVGKSIEGEIHIVYDFFASYKHAILDFFVPHPHVKMSSQIFTEYFKRLAEEKAARRIQRTYRQRAEKRLWMTTHYSANEQPTEYIPSSRSGGKITEFRGERL